MVNFETYPNQEVRLKQDQNSENHVQSIDHRDAVEGKGHLNFDEGRHKKGADDNLYYQVASGLRIIPYRCIVHPIVLQLSQLEEELVVLDNR